MNKIRLTKSHCLVPKSVQKICKTKNLNLRAFTSRSDTGCRIMLNWGGSCTDTGYKRYDRWCPFFLPLFLRGSLMGCWHVSFWIDSLTFFTLNPIGGILWRFKSLLGDTIPRQFRIKTAISRNNQGFSTLDLPGSSTILWIRFLGYSAS